MPRLLQQQQKQQQQQQRQQQQRQQQQQHRLQQNNNNNNNNNNNSVIFATMMSTAAAANVNDDTTKSQQQERISTMFDPDAHASIPRFEVNELVIGRILGKGGFCTVQELNKLKLKGASGSRSRKNNWGVNSNSSSSGSETTYEDYMDDHTVMTRETVSKLVKSSKKSTMKKKSVGGSSKHHQHHGGGVGGVGGYCVKRVAQCKTSQYHKATMDLLAESKFLASLCHDNILKIRGMSKTSSSGDQFYDYKAFLILDQLHETFAQRLKTWSQKDRRTKGVTGAVFSLSFLGNGFGRQYRREKLWIDRLQAAYDVADVMSYLHAHNIIYRDLKPANIGFDAYGTVKLFDFGLAKELRPEDIDRETGCYPNLTGCTGAIRYMAPEVGLSQPYNLKADVYSWSLLLWCILALHPPFENYTTEMMVDTVFTPADGNENGVRPTINETAWPTQLSQLMKDCWQTNLHARPTFFEIKPILRSHLVAAGTKYLEQSNHTAPLHHDEDEIIMHNHHHHKNNKSNNNNNIDHSHHLSSLTLGEC